MWGRHVDAQLSEAVKGAKTDKAAHTKALMVINRLMRDPEEAREQEEQQEETARPKPTEKKFRDPAELFARK